MSCYLRDMGDVLEEAGVKLTPENRKEVDKLVHQLVSVQYKNCQLTRKMVKEAIKGPDRKVFIQKLRQAASTR